MHLISSADLYIENIRCLFISLLEYISLHVLFVSYKCSHLGGGSGRIQSFTTSKSIPWEIEAQESDPCFPSASAHERIVEAIDLK